MILGHHPHNDIPFFPSYYVNNSCHVRVSAPPATARQNTESHPNPYLCIPYHATPSPYPNTVTLWRWNLFIFSFRLFFNKIIFWHVIWTNKNAIFKYRAHNFIKIKLHYAFNFFYKIALMKSKIWNLNASHYNKLNWVGAIWNED